jgi:hypothetical protein
MRWVWLLGALAACSGASGAGDAGGVGDLASGGDFAGADLAAGDLAGRDAIVIVPPDGGTLQATLSFTLLNQDCMPVVAPDPVQVSGTITLANNGATPVGPISGSTGAFLSAGGVQLASFQITPVNLGSIAPGGTVSSAFDKVVNSLMPAAGCNTIACSSMVRTIIFYDGPGVPPGSFADGGLMPFTCAF